MTFQDPLLLPVLLLVPGLALLYLLAQRRRAAYAVRFTNLDLLASVAGRRPGFRRHLPAALFLVGLSGLLLAAADPVLNLEIARNRASVMLVIDTSGSMQATDVAPSRLDAARSAAHTLVDHLPANAEVGLVSFNSTATLVSPLTADRFAVGTALASLRPGGGTAIGDGLNAALAELERSRAANPVTTRTPAMIVMLTDGASNAGVDPQAAAGTARATAVPVITIGVGRRDVPTYVRGQLVEGVNEQALQEIATTTGGKYYYAEAAGQLSSIYSSLGSAFGWQFLRVDILLPTLILGTLVLVAGGLLSLRWFRLFP